MTASTPPATLAGGVADTAAVSATAPVPGVRDGALLVQYRTGTRIKVGTDAPGSDRAGVALTVSRVLGGGTVRVALPAGTGPEGVAAITAQLRTDPAVVSVEPDVWFTVQDDPVVTTAVPAAPNDTLYASQQWHYDGTWGIRMRQAWEVTQGSSDVIVAVVDTGITSHPELDAAVLGTGADLISNAAEGNDGSGRDMNAADPGDWITAEEDASGYFAGCGVDNSTWHGTHVAGTIAAATNNGAGVAGIAPGVRILPVRVLGKCGGWMSDVADGVRWAAGLPVSGLTTNPHPAQVISLSLGGGGACSVAMQSAVTAAIGAGSTVIVAAGNSGANASTATPANCSGVISVAATTVNGVRASYSNYGATVTLAGPGGDGSGPVWSTLNTGTTVPSAPGYAGYAGTSMATPHVSAVAALVLSVHPGLTPAQVRTILTSTVTAFPASVVSPSCSAGQCGAGIVNARAAVAAALVTKLDQGLAFSPLGVAAIGGSEALTATTTSGQAASFALDATSACSLSGATLHFLAAGSCTVRASVPATDIWAADEAVQVIETGVGDVITLEVDAIEAVYGAGTIGATASATSGLPVTITVAPPSVCTFASGVVTLLASGACEVTATTAGNATYSPGTASATITVAKAFQTLVPAFPAALVAGVGATLDVSGAQTAVGYASLTPLVCAVSGATVTGVNAGTCTVRASAVADSRYDGATVEADMAVSLRSGAPGSLSVGYGASATHTTAVRLALSWPSWATSAQVASNSAFSGPTVVGRDRAWMNWTLSGVDGIKTVYIRYRAATYTDQATSDSIRLDRKVPTIGSATASVVARAAGKRTLRVSLSASGTGSSIVAYQVTSNRASPGTWKPWADPFRVTTAATVLYVRVRDAAGNAGAWKTLYPPR